MEQPTKFKSFHNLSAFVTIAQSFFNTNLNRAEAFDTHALYILTLPRTLLKAYLIKRYLVLFEARLHRTEPLDQVHPYRERFSLRH